MSNKSQNQSSNNPKLNKDAYDVANVYLLDLLIKRVLITNNKFE